MEHMGIGILLRASLIGPRKKIELQIRPMTSNINLRIGTTTLEQKVTQTPNLRGTKIQNVLGVWELDILHPNVQIKRPCL